MICINNGILAPRNIPQNVFFGRIAIVCEYILYAYRLTWKDEGDVDGAVFWDSAIGKRVEGAKPDSLVHIVY